MFSAVVPPVHGRVVSAVTAASAAIVATLKAHPLQRTSFAAGNCQVDGGICDVHPSFCSLKATRNKNSTCNVIKVVNFLKCLSPSSEFMDFFFMTKCCWKVSEPRVGQNVWECSITPSCQQGTHISSCRALAPWWSSSSSSSVSSSSS